MKWLFGALLLAGVALSWARFVLPSARRKYTEWARTLTGGQVILYAVTMAVFGILFAQFTERRVPEDNPGRVLFLAIVAGFFFRAYWVPWLWLGRSREVVRR
jgi:4-amino-4-deoxy-L-arabinose transferase-like glycosyltransferase